MAEFESAYLGGTASSCLGVTSEDPLTSVYAVNHAGEEFPGEPLMLWAPPRDTAING